jgi:hypothetical protein
MAHEKKSQLLGMSFMTARGRLERDLLFKLAVAAGYCCFRCGGPLTRDTFSVEHKKPWAHETDPKAAFFDLENVAFSHGECNHREMIERHKIYPNARAAGRAWDKRQWDQMSSEERRRSRRERYTKYGY